MPKYNVTNHNTEDDINGVVQTIRELTDARNQFMCENEELSEQIAELNYEIESLESRHQKVLDTLEEQESQIEHLQKENKELQCEIEVSEMEISKQKAVACDIEDMQVEKTCLSKDVKYCKCSLLELKNAVRKVEETLEEKKQVNAKLEKQINRNQAKMNKYKKAKDVLEDENDCAQRCNTEAKTAIENAKAKNERLQEEIKVAEKARRKLEEQTKKCAAYIRQLKLKLAKEQQIGHTQQNKVQDICENIAKTKKEMQLLREEEEALNEELHEIEGEIEMSRCELKRKEQAITSMRDKIMSNRNNNGCNAAAPARLRRPKRRCSCYGQEANACTSVLTLFRSSNKDRGATRAMCVVSRTRRKPTRRKRARRKTTRRKR